MLLKYYKASGVTSAPLKGKASRYVSLGYHRLLNYRESGGGFSYWGHGSPDAALTAYAVRFLLDVSPFTDVDPEIIQGAERWLVSSSIRAESSNRTSVLYDYYNPEALVALPPADFIIKASPQSEPVEAVAAK
jgi:hypothetical protein